MELMKSYFFIIQGLIFIYCITNALFWNNFRKKLENLLREKYTSRWLQNHGGANPINLSYYGQTYVWSNYDMEIPELFSIKMKIRVTMVLTFLTFPITVINFLFFNHLGLFSGAH